MSNNKCNLPRSTRGSVNSAKCSCSVAGCGSGMVGVLLWPLSDSPLQHTPGLAACQDSLPPQLSTPLRAFALVGCACAPFFCPRYMVRAAHPTTVSIQKLCVGQLFCLGAAFVACHPWSN